MVAWLRSRNLLTMFLAAVTGRALLITENDEAMGISEGAMRLDAWLRAARQTCEKTNSDTILVGASPLRRQAEKFAASNPIESVSFIGDAETVSALGSVVFMNVRSSSSAEVRELVIDISVSEALLGGRVGQRGTIIFWVGDMGWVVGGGE